MLMRFINLNLGTWNLKFLSTLLAILLCGLVWGQDFYRDKIAHLKSQLAITTDPEERIYLREQIEDVQRQIRDRRDRQEMDFEQQLNHIRSGMIADDQRSVVAMAHVKLDKALYAFLQTDFMKEYKNLKIEAESLAATFKARASQLPPSTVSRVKQGYTEVSDGFNQFIIEVKRDFLNRKKLKLIKNDKEMYVNSLQYRLQNLKHQYAQDFERVVAEATGSDLYAAVPLAAIFGLIKLAKDFTEFLITSSYEAKRVKEDHLNQYLIEPYRFRSWFEIEMLEGDVFHQDQMPPPYREPEPEDIDEMDPFEYDVDAPSLSRKKPKKKKE